MMHCGDSPECRRSAYRICPATFGDECTAAPDDERHGAHSAPGAGAVAGTGHRRRARDLDLVAAARLRDPDVADRREVRPLLHRRLRPDLVVEIVVELVVG